MDTLLDNKTTFIHIAVEIVVICIIVYVMNRKTSSLTTSLKNLTDTVMTQQKQIEEQQKVINQLIQAMTNANMPASPVKEQSKLQAPCSKTHKHHKSRKSSKVLDTINEEDNTEEDKEYEKQEERPEGKTEFKPEGKLNKIMSKPVLKIENVPVHKPKPVIVLPIEDELDRELANELKELESDDEEYENEYGSD